MSACCSGPRGAVGRVDNGKLVRELPEGLLVEWRGHDQADHADAQRLTDAIAQHRTARTPLHLAAQAYDWRNVTIKGTGFINGIVFHPAQPD